MTLFPPEPPRSADETAGIRLDPDIEKAVLSGTRAFIAMERELKARLTRMSADVDRLMMAFAKGGVIASQKALAVIEERKRRLGR